MSSTRIELIHEKGFDMSSTRIDQYGKIRVGVKTLDDAILDIGALPKIDRYKYNKPFILRALDRKDVKVLRDISDSFYSLSGIYAKACNYIATLYRYDWYIVPEIYEEKPKEDKILKEYVSMLNYFDNSHIRKTCGDIALKVIKDGAYYGYIVEGKNSLLLQELPIDYCRSRYTIEGFPAIEFNMRFFDEKFPDANYRARVLKMFPKEFAKGYILYKQGKLVPDNVNMYDTRHGYGWYLLEPGSTVKFSLGNDDIPYFVNVIPYILDLDDAQDLDRRKQMQKLLKIIIQKLPLDKNNDLVFDMDEAQDIHNNAVAMLKRAVGVDVLTTFADIDSIDMSDKNTTTSKDDLEKVERTVFNAMGISQNLFNTEGNMSLEKSILNDESAIRGLLFQFIMMFDRMAQKKSKTPKKWNFRFYMLETTQHNYKELSKMYKEQDQIGFSKLLPQIALGHSQNAIINTAFFENNILHLSEIMIPPLMSSTMNLADLQAQKDGKNQDKNGGNDKSGSNQQVKVAADDKEAGRPEKPDSEKSDKTIANRESMS